MELTEIAPLFIHPPYFLPARFISFCPPYNFLSILFKDLRDMESNFRQINAEEARRSETLLQLVCFYFRAFITRFRYLKYQEICQ